MKKFLGLMAATVLSILPSESASNPIIVSQNISAVSENVYDILPWQMERLAEPIRLSNCPGTNIIEWRPAPSNQDKELLNKTCSKIFKKYTSFLKSEGIQRVPVFNDFRLDLSLIPVSGDFRNLNDHTFRFKNRVKTYDDEGNIAQIWGYTDFRNKISFIRSDITIEKGKINSKTLVVFAHEMYHALSRQLGIDAEYHFNSKIDEEMAQKFTNYLGM